MKYQTRAIAPVTIFAIAIAVALGGCAKQGTSSDSSSTGTVSLKSIKVALVPGGEAAYFTPWIKAGAAAEKDFGIGKVTFNDTSNWDQTTQTSTLNSLGAQGYNAYGIFGVSATDINSNFQTLKKDKFAVASLASCPAGNVNDADFCLSTDTKTAAYKETKEVISAMGGSGNLVALSGDDTDTNTVRRIDGVKKAVAETNGAVKLLTTVTNIETTLQIAEKSVNDLLATKGTQIQGIVATTYNTAVAAAQGVTQTGLPIKVVGTDDDPIVLAAIKSGKLAGTVVQNPYGQAYVGSWAIANLQAGNCTVPKPGFVVDSGSFLVTQSNLTTYNAARDAKTASLLKDFQTKLLDCKK